MSWGMANRPITSNKLGGPGEREGTDGDIQVRQTNLGGKLFGKLGGRWYDIPLGIAGITKFGTSSSNYLSIDRDSLDVIKNSKNVASFGATMRVGEDSTSKSALRVDSLGALTIGKKGAAANFSVDADGTVSLTSDDVNLSPTSGTIEHGDSLIFIDANDSNATKKGSLSTFITNVLAGAGLTGSSSVLSVDADQSGQITSVGTLTALTLSGNITMADDTSIGISDSDERIEFDAAGDISFLGCNVGIGLTSPAAKLHVTHGTSAEWAGQFVQTHAGGYGVLIDVEDAATDPAFKVKSGSTVCFNVDGSGNCGIGTDDPGALLHIYKDDDSNLSIVEMLRLQRHADDIGSNTNAEGGYISMYVTDDNYGGEMARITWRADNADNLEDEGKLIFSTALGDAGAGSPAITERLVIDKNGFVGIGVDDPDTRLEVFAGTTNQLKLSFDDTDNCTFGVDTDGYLTITPSGSKILIADNDSIGSSSFVSGFAGNGWIVDDGTTVDATFDNLSVRGTMSVYELLIQQIRATNGSVMITSAAKVESSSGLSASDDDGTITFEPAIANTCPFLANDIIMCQQVNPGVLVDGDAAGSGVTGLIKKMVYKVASVSNNVCTVENIGFNNVETNGPVAGDDFVRIGNTGTASRQSVMYLTSDDTNAPFIDMKADIESYADWHAEGSTKLRLGRLDGLTAGGTNEYGLWAGPSTANYIKAGSGGVFIKGSEATYLKATANTIEFFDTNKKMSVTGGNITMFNDAGDTAVAVWNDDVITLGLAAGEHITIDSNSIDFHDGTRNRLVIGGGSNSIDMWDQAGTKVLNITSGVVTLLSSSSDKLTLDSSGIVFHMGGADVMSLDAGNISMTGQIIITSTGTDNVVIGDANSNDAGTANVVIGIGAGAALTSLNFSNVMVGSSAGEALDTGDENVCIGRYAGQNIEDGDRNVCIGNGAGSGMVDNDNSIAIGRRANYAGTGTNNVVIGHLAGGDLTTAIDQILIGATAGGVNQTGFGAVCIGSGTDTSEADGDGEIVIGYNATGQGKNYAVIGRGEVSRLYVNEDGDGEIFANATINDSDKRMKENIGDIGLGLNFINKLAPVKYTRRQPADYEQSLKEKLSWYGKKDPKVIKDTEKARIQAGFLAQDVMDVLKELNFSENNGMVRVDDVTTQYRIDYASIVVPLTKAVQELSAKMDTMQEEINNLKAGV